MRNPLTLRFSFGFLSTASVLALFAALFFRAFTAAPFGDDPSATGTQTTEGPFHYAVVPHPGDDRSGASSSFARGADDPKPPVSGTRSAVEPVPTSSGHPSDALLATAELVRERWSDPDVVGNFNRTAVYRSSAFKHEWLRLTEQWSGKTGLMLSRVVMVADHVLLAPSGDVEDALLEERLALAGFQVRQRQSGRLLLVSFANGIDDPAELPRQIVQLEDWEDLVQFAEPDYLVFPCLAPNDPAFQENKLWGLRNPGGVNGYVAGADIDTVEAWAIRHDASGIVVAVTDTGIRHDHEDLFPNMWQNPGEIAGNGVDDDGNGVIDDVFGYNALHRNGDTMDELGHGSHVAGIIGAHGNNNLGTTGVAWNVQLMSGKFLGPFGGTTSDAVTVIDYAREMGADIINASWGGGGESQMLRRAIADCATAGMLFVAAAGNYGADNDSAPQYPASFQLPNIVAVAASNASDELTAFSNYGRNTVHIVAPGWQIWSTFHESPSAYRFQQGTSMAAPHVAGALALARAHFPDDSADELIARLYRSADLLPALNEKVTSGGRLNLFRLLSDSEPVVSNKSFDRALPLEGIYATWRGSNKNAVRDPADSDFPPLDEERTLWFAWQAPEDGIVTLTTNSLGAGQRMVVFRGEDRDALSIVLDSGPQSATSAETVERFLAEAGGEYRILLASGSESGELISMKLELIAAHDLLTHAVTLTGEEFEVQGSNRGATAQPFEVSRPHAEVGAGHSVWYRWTASFTDSFTISTEGSATDTVLAVYIGDPLDPHSFVEIAANDDAGPMDRWSQVVFTTVEETVYFIAVDSALGGTPGSFVLRGMRPAPPVITSEPADIEVVLGGRAVFSVGASGNPAVRYQWFRNGDAIPGGWDRSLVIDPVTAAALADYHVEARNVFGTAISRTARLNEKLTAPVIAWQSGDQSAVEGTSLEVRVEVRGSAPLSYEWRHKGALIAEANSSTLILSSLSAESAGTYECRVSNAIGQAEAKMVVTLVNSPFESWEWRLDSMPGPPVTDIRVIDGKAYAVTGDRVLVSADGIDWTPWLLPPHFEGVAIAKLDDIWICSGMNRAGSGRVAISTDGITWTLHTPSGLLGSDTTSSPIYHVARLEVFDGRLLGQAGRTNSTYGTVVTSTDGIAWSNAIREDTSGSFSVNGPFAVGSDAVVAGSSFSGANARAFRSVDGVTWKLFTLPAATGVGSDSSRGATRWNGQFVLFSLMHGHGWASPDGMTWTVQTGSTWSGGIDLEGDFVFMGGTWNNGISIAWSDTPWSATQTFLRPPTGDIVSAYAAFNGKVVYGTERGFLGQLAGPADLQPFGSKVTVPNQIVFADERFIALEASTNGTGNSTPLVSGDGIHWRTMRRWSSDVVAHPIAGFGGGQFWGQVSTYSGTGPSRGLLPHTMAEDPEVTGLSKYIQSLVADGDTLLAVTNQKLYRSTDGGKNWQEVSSAPVFSQFSSLDTRVIRSGSHWLLTNGDPVHSYQTGFVHFSTDGLDWTKTNGKPGFIVPFGDRLFGLEGNSGSPTVRGWESTDNGLTWSEVPFDSTNSFPIVEIRQLGVFSGSLVALVGTPRSLYFSPDGRSWFLADTPSGLLGFATGAGQFVGYTSTGAIVQAGSPTPGGAAPVVRANYPIHLSGVVSGSWVDVTGEAFDPEGGPVAVECFVDGERVGSAGSGPFRFRFRGDAPAGHIVQLRATDAYGLVGSDELRVNVTPPQGTNLIESAEGRDYLPSVALVEFNGAFYAAGAQGIRRSIDGLHWEPVLLPSLASKLRGLAAGNGSLVAQTEWGVLYTTRDGVNWIQVGPDTFSGYWIRQPIVFTSGHFLVLQQVAGSSAVNYRTSTNGLDWESAGAAGDSTTRAVIGHNGVILSVHDILYGDWQQAVWSADGGHNWTPIPGISRHYTESLGFALGYGNGVFLAGLSDGRMWRSTDGRSWIAGNLPPAPAPVIVIRHAGDRFFAGSFTHFFFTSEDGITWETLESPLHSEAIVHELGRYVARGENGMAWSHDGVSWQDAQGGPTTAIDLRLAANGDRFLVIDANGAAWSSNNGVVWRQDFTGFSATTDTSHHLGQHMARLGESVLLAGTNGMLAFSTDEAATWQPATVNGAVVPNNWNFSRVEVSSDVALATAVVGRTENRVVVRSTDGRDWYPLPTLASYRAVDVAGNGAGTWVAVGAHGAILRSSDHGASWKLVMGASMVTARAVAWFNNEWLIFGAPTSGDPSHTWSSPDGATWIPRGPNGLNYTTNPYFRVEGHGSLVVWNRTDRPVITTDGRSWQPFRNNNSFSSNSKYWVAPSASGFTFATPYITAQARGQMFQGTPDGQSWIEVPRPQNDTRWGASFEGRLFLFATGSVIEWPDADLEIELLPAIPVTLGVGNTLEMDATIRNIGIEEVSGPLEVDGWLSPDRFFGDGNDVYLGRVLLDVSAPGPGAEVTTSIGFRLPGQIRPGNAHLIVVLDPEQKVRDRIRSNNVSLSESAVAIIPQRRLTMLTNGNGMVFTDQVSEYYPHGARIGLVARPGKGARFAGWGADAVGALSESLIILDADKTVLANFVSTAALTVFSRGGGSVGQTAEDGVYGLGETAELQAVPLPGWTFAGWSGALSETNTEVSLEMDRNKVVTATFALDFASWAELHFSAVELSDSSVSGLSADPDGDRLQNWREWIRGSEPRDGADLGQGTLRREGQWLVLTYSRLETMPAGYNVQAFASIDLLDWALPIDERIIGSVDGIETIEVRFEAAGLPSAFLRVTDTRP